MRQCKKAAPQGEEPPPPEFHQGEIIERQPECRFIVRLDDGRFFFCHIARSWGHRAALPNVGDRIWIERWPDTDDRGRIVPENRVKRLIERLPDERVKRLEKPL